MYENRNRYDDTLKCMICVRQSWREGKDVLVFLVEFLERLIAANQKIVQTAWNTLILLFACFEQFYTPHVKCEMRV